MKKIKEEIINLQNNDNKPYYNIKPIKEK